MKIQTVKAEMIDKYGFKYVHKTTNKIGKKKQISTEVISCNGSPLFKRVTNGKKVQEFDRSLFNGWIVRTNEQKL